MGATPGLKFTVFVDVEVPHLVVGVEVLIEVGVAAGRVHRVVLVVLGNVLRGGLWQKPEDGLPLGQDLQDRLGARRPLLQHVAGVHAAQEAAGGAGASRPKRLKCENATDMFNMFNSQEKPVLWAGFFPR